MQNLSSDVPRTRDLGLAELSGKVLSQATVKRLFDIVVAASALLVLAPVFFLLIRLVRRDGAAAFYAQRRIGHGGREFRCFKFRTMVPNAEQQLSLILASSPALRAEFQQYWKLKADPRITPIGQLLRRYSLDELPQLINVLRGEMSLVGPRPRSPSEVKTMEESFASAFLYTRVKPGLTGLWQVSGRNTLTLAEKAMLDAEYVKSWTPLGDLKLIARTVAVVLSGHGAH